SREAVAQYAGEIGVDTAGFDYFDNSGENLEQLAAEYAARFNSENDISAKGVMRKAKDPVNCAMFLAKLDKVDGVAAGRVYTTGDVINAGMQIVGVQAGFKSVSSVGILDVPGFEGPEGNMLVIGDCAVSTQPDADDLADIALASADTVTSLLGWEPRVAMLAFSTKGSAEHDTLEPIREGIKIARERRPGLKIDGEFQLDSAINPKVAASKVKEPSEVAGKANILIFPNLHAGNIGVKLIQTFGKADAYGPVLQGFAKPISDFSRGAPLSEMMGNITMLIVRAQG
ncbi:phosphate acetyltransferase, partial [Ruminococcaceae bacterium OttesenSCG-928-D13]|nr:phosphate acetyltransferase [Ruminococcaceae bacterium OttesenSCG-928-D13]